MILKINDLTKNYGQKTAVKNLNVELTEGIYGFLGPNGSGKSTTIRMICGILNPTSGTIEVNGENIDQMGERFPEILGYLPQNFGYYPEYTGFDFMMYVCALKGLERKKAKEKTKELLKKFNLYEHKNKKIKAYSGGMRQRLGIAQSLINDPKILILDEPTAGLDPKERIRLKNIISDLSKDKIIILSTHIVTDVEQIADEIMFLKEGKLINKDNVSNLLKTIEQKVWSVKLNENDFDMMRDDFMISNISYIGDKVNVKIISNEKPFDTAINVAPRLEDLYLFYFDDILDEEK
ncbi:MAG: ATP-binding cassette domain-containing protein [Clostridioides sp.]|jgi:ABC-2 type transport system ATP-binding protein|nr:ATP-binding cassette domain-containing protein [Clostridioides sp.]